MPFFTKTFSTVEGTDVLNHPGFLYPTVDTVESFAVISVVLLINQLSVSLIHRALEKVEIDRNKHNRKFLMVLIFLWVLQQRLLYKLDASLGCFPYAFTQNHCIGSLFITPYPQYIFYLVLNDRKRISTIY